MEKLITWLRQQIAEDRRIANAAHSRTTRGTEQWCQKDARIVDNAGNLIVTHSWVNEIAHIVRHDPRTVLAQCDAHEKILNLAETVYVEHAAVTALALAYQYRAGYDEAVAQ